MPTIHTRLSPLLALSGLVLGACASQAGGFFGGDGGGDGSGGEAAGGAGGAVTDTGTGTFSGTGTGTGTSSSTDTGTGTGTGMGATCGDATCGGGETCTSCAADCGACPPVCGDQVCEAGESASCPQDCGGGACSHSPCVSGPALDAACDACADVVCFLDDFCCAVEWDVYCVDTAFTYCVC